MHKCGICTGSTNIGTWGYNREPSRVPILCCMHCTHISRKVELSSAALQRAQLGYVHWEHIYRKLEIYLRALYVAYIVLHTHISRKLQISSKRPLDVCAVLTALQALGAHLQETENTVRFLAYVWARNATCRNRRVTRGFRTQYENSDQEKNTLVARNLIPAISV